MAEFIPHIIELWDSLGVVRHIELNKISKPYELPAATALPVPYPSFGQIATIDYAIMSPDVSITEIETSMREGSEIVAASRRNVTESCTIRISPSDLTNHTLAIASVQAVVQNLERLFRQAEQSQIGIVDGIYVHFRPRGYTEAYRSEILTGRVEINEASLQSFYWEVATIDAQITWTRRFYWETATELVVPAHNPYGFNTLHLSSSNSTIIYNYLTYTGKAYVDLYFDHGLIVGQAVTFAGFVPSTFNGSFTVADVVAPDKFTVVVPASSPTIPTTYGTITANENLIVRNTNHLASAWYDYLDIQGLAVYGSVPAPVRVEVIDRSSITATTLGLSYLYIAQNVFSDPQNFPYILEGETSFDHNVPVHSPVGANGHNEPPTQEVLATSQYSGGRYKYIEWYGYQEQTMFSWTLNSSLLAQGGGGYFRLLARFTVIAYLYLRFRVVINNELVWEGPEIRTEPGHLHELGTVRLPPFLYTKNPPYNLYPLTLTMVGRAVPGFVGLVAPSSALDPRTGIGLDRLYLLPLDGFRRVEAIIKPSVYNERWVVDEMAGKCYSDNSGGAYPSTGQPGRLGNLTMEGNPIVLWPSRDQRIFFVTGSKTTVAPNYGEAIAYRQEEIRMYYRPRRLTL